MLGGQTPPAHELQRGRLQACAHFITLSHTLLLSLFDLINGTWIVGIHPDQYKRPAKTARAQRFNTD